MAEFRFYAELSDFLPPCRRGNTFHYVVFPRQSAKHVIEALGVPHTEIGLLLVNGQPSALNCRLGPNDRVAVYPAFCHLIPPRNGAHCRFIADAHLGRLARYLRFAGFDTLWENASRDADLVAAARIEARILLTRDRDLLMHKALTAGCYVRDKDPLSQLTDVAHRYSLDLLHPGPARCLECNVLLRRVSKEAVIERLPPATKAVFSAFWQCDGCGRVFWQGSHWKRMRNAIADIGQRLGCATTQG